MALKSFEFLCFFTVLLGLYYIIPGKIQNLFLLAVNMLFCYYAGGKRLIVFLLFLTVITYAGAVLIEKYKEDKKQKWILWITTCSCIGILVVLKYINFFIYTGRGISGLLGIPNSWTTINIIAPLGISFFTLQLLSVLLSSYTQTFQDTWILRWGCTGVRYTDGRKLPDSILFMFHIGVLAEMAYYTGNMV